MTKRRSAAHAREVQLTWACTRVQRRWRALTERRRAVDPATLCPIAVGDEFVVVEPDGHRFLLDKDSVARDALASGTFRNPVTRRELDEVEVRRLLRACAASHPELTEARDVAPARRACARESDSIGFFCEDEAREAWREFLDVVCAFEAPFSRRAFDDMRRGFLPRALHLMRQLRSIDADAPVALLAQVKRRCDLLVATMDLATWFDLSALIDEVALDLLLSPPATATR